MKYRRLNQAITLSGLALASIALAADHPTGSPNQQSEFDLLSMPSDVAIGKNSQTYIVDSGNHQVAVFRVLSVASALTLIGYLFAASTFGAIGVATVGATSVVLQGLVLSLIAYRLLGVNTLPQFSIRSWKLLLKQISNR